MPEPDPAEKAHATAAYVADLAAGLAALAKSSRLDTLSYLLEMARLEAEELCRRVGHTPRRRP